MQIDFRDIPSGPFRMWDGDGREVLEAPIFWCDTETGDCLERVWHDSTKTSFKEDEAGSEGLAEVETWYKPPLVIRDPNGMLFDEMEVE